MKTMTLTEGRKRLFELSTQVLTDQIPIVLTQPKGDVVLISATEWESSQETYRLLHDHAALAALLQSFETHGQSSGKSLEEVFEDLL